jgi:hypothetical protein
MKTITSKQFRSWLMSALMLTGAYVVANILGAHDALAQGATQNTTGGVGTVITNAQSNIRNAANLIYIAAYTGGVSALMMGAFKLKAHAENPAGQVPLQAGLSRLAVGAGLIALPSVANTGINTIFGTTSQQTLQGGTIQELNTQTN